MGAPRAPYMAKTDKERLATGFWNRIESNQATDCNSDSFLFQWIDLTNYAKVPLLGALSAFPFSNGLNISLAIVSCSSDAH